MRDSNPLSSPPLFSLVLYNIVVNSNLIGHLPIPENLLSSKRGGGALPVPRLFHYIHCITRLREMSTLLFHCMRTYI